jgi:hypothetical protein
MPIRRNTGEDYVVRTIMERLATEIAAGLPYRILDDREYFPNRDHWRDQLFTILTQQRGHTLMPGFCCVCNTPTRTAQPTDSGAAFFAAARFLAEQISGNLHSPLCARCWFAFIEFREIRFTPSTLAKVAKDCDCVDLCLLWLVFEIRPHRADLKKVGDIIRCHNNPYSSGYDLDDFELAVSGTRYQGRLYYQKDVKRFLAHDPELYDAVAYKRGWSSSLSPPWADLLSSKAKGSKEFQSLIPFWSEIYRVATRG